MIKFISYDGKYPNLCSGKLVLEVDGKQYTFPEFCLRSGGSAYFTNHYRNSHITHGEWSIKAWPDDFPEELKDEAVCVVNANVKRGCCGGCL